MAVAVLDRVCRLRGGRALRALEWNEQGAFLAVIGQPGRRLAAVADPASQRFGSWLWLLRFETAEGAIQVLLDPEGNEWCVVRSAT